MWEALWRLDWKERPIRWYLDHGPGIVTKLGTKGAQVPQAVEEEGGE